MKRLYELFGQSPFKPLEEHMIKTMEAVELIPSFMDNYLNGDYEKAKELFKKICKKEHEADIVKKNIRDHLPKTILMPVARAELLGYLKDQDNIADAAEDIATLCMIKMIKLPNDLRPALMELIQANINTVKIVAEISRAISALSSASFAGKRADHMQEQIEKIEFEEWQCDKLQMTFAKQLFEHEKKMDATTVMLWFNIIRVISKLSNASENVGTQMRIMIAKR